MRWTSLAAVASLTACAAASVPTLKPISTPIFRSGQTSSGQPLRLPQGPAEVVTTIVVIPPGAMLPLHRHPWSRFAYVEQGIVRVTNRDSGQTREFRQGQVLAEAVGQWHEGRSVGSTATRLIVFDLVPPGTNNVAIAPLPK